MNNYIIGNSITWTPWSPMDTGMIFQDFMAFINEKTEIEVDDAFIKGEVNTSTSCQR